MPGGTVVAETARLRLRQASVADAAFILALMNEPGWLQYIGDRGVRTLEDAERYIRNRFQADYTRLGYGMYVVAHLDDERPVGLCGLVNRDWLPAPDIGFAIRADEAGRGFGYESATAILSLARENFGLARLLAVTTPDNRPSRRLLTRLGFKCMTESHLSPENEFLCLYSRDFIPQMSPGRVAESYDRIADRWCAAHFNMKNGIEAHRKALDFLDKSNRQRAALDVGCGASGRLIELMNEAGLAAEGLDLSAKMLARARDRHPDVTFHHADICQWIPPHPYTFISAWDSLWHTPLEQQTRILARLLNALEPGGVMILTSGGLHQPGETRDEAMGVPMYHAAPGIPALMDTIERTHCVCRHLEYDQWPELHIFVIAQKMPNP